MKNEILCEKAQTLFNSYSGEKMVCMIWTGQSAKVAPNYSIKKNIDATVQSKKKKVFFDRIKIQEKEKVQT